MFILLLRGMVARMMVVVIMMMFSITEITNVKISMPLSRGW